MMGILVPETCWAYKKNNKIISDIYLVFILQFNSEFTTAFTAHLPEPQILGLILKLGVF